MSVLNLHFKLALLLLLASVTMSYGAGNLSGSGKKAQIYSAKTGYGRVYRTFQDTRFVTGEKNSEDYDYISSSFFLYQLNAEFRNYFSNDFNTSLTFIDIQPASKQIDTEYFDIKARFIAALHIAIIKKFNFLYGSTTMITLKKDSRDIYSAVSEKKKINSGMSIDSDHSYVYPSFGFYFFPEDVVGFNISFLDHNANIMYGWLQASIWYNVTESSKLQLGLEFFNENNFGDNLKKFVDASSTLFTRYQYSSGNFAIGGKLGIVLVESQQQKTKVILLPDRIFTEISVSFNL